MDLCAVLLGWVMHLSDFKELQGCPEMRTVSHAWLEQKACDGNKCRVLGWYPGEGDVIYLDERLDLDDTVHASIALHEIVHWAQGKAGFLSDDCETSIQAERQAYAIQREFLTQYGSLHPVGSVLRALHCDE